jgi:outer membrane receptor for ferrienterochelin and colicins
MSKSLLLIVIIFLSFQSVSQIITVSGKVVDIKKNHIPYAHIADLSSNNIVVCNSSGSFSININQSVKSLVVSAVGYEKSEFIINTTILNKQLIILNENNDLLNEMVISGTLELIERKNSPIPIAVYSTQFLNTVPAPSLVEATNQISGLRPQINCSVCNTGDIHINGMEGAYSMVVVDGMPIMGGLSTVYGLQGIPTSLIDQVEVIKGPASTIYGSEAMAGLINVVTKNVDCIPKLAVDFNISSWGESQTSFSFKYLDKKKFKAFSAVDVFYYNNPIDNNEDNFTDLSLKKRYSIFNKFQFFSKNGLNPLNISIRYLNEDRWGGEMDWTIEDRGKNLVYGESILTNRLESSAFFQFPKLKQLKWQNSFSLHDQKSWYGTVYYQAKQIIGFSQLTIHKKIKLKHNFLSGLALRYNNYDDNTPATSSADSWWLPGLFFQDNFNVDNNHKILFGWRTDYHIKHGFIHSPRINYQWDLAEHTTLRLGYGDGFRVVNVFTEDHAALTGSREVVFLEELKPEKSKNLNLSISNNWDNKHINISIESSIFSSKFSNKIIPDFLTNDNQIIYSNLNGYALARGVSSEIFLKFKKCPLKFSLNGTLLDISSFERESNNDNLVKSVQLLAEKYSIKWTIFYSFEKLGLDLNYAATNYGPIRLPLLENDFRREYSLPYTIHNFKLTKNFSGGWSTFISVRNFTNFTPPNYSILRSFDPFDQQINNTIDNPNGYTFDASYMYASFQGLNFVFGGSIIF